MKGVDKRFFKYNIVYSVFGLTKGKVLEKDKMEKLKMAKLILKI